MLDPESDADPLSKPIFTNAELFKKFEESKDFMGDEKMFVLDLKKYFTTAINPQENFKHEIRKILKVFFCHIFLNSTYTGTRLCRDKELFKNTKFAKALTEVVMIEYEA